MTTSPQSLRDLGSYWTRHGGVNLGVIGDKGHTIGYHLGRDRIFGPGGAGADDYSVMLLRDKQGLSLAASAIDLGKLDGTLKGLQDFSRWLVRRCQSHAEGSRDIREIIYSPDGVKVQRWSGVDNTIHTGPGNGDLSHRTHTHISYYRDSEFRDKRPLFRPYFETEADMIGFTLAPDSRTGTVRVSIAGAAAIRLDDGALIGLTVGEDKEVMGFGKLLKPFGTGSGNQADRQSGYLLYGVRPAWLLAYAGTFTPDADLIPRAAAVAAIEAVP